MKKLLLFVFTAVAFGAAAQNGSAQSLTFRTGYSSFSGFYGSCSELHYSLPLSEHFGLTVADAADFANADITPTTTYYQAFANCISVGVNAHVDFAQRCSLRATALVGMDIWSARNVSGAACCAASLAVSGSVDFSVKVRERCSVGLFAGIGSCPDFLDNGNGSLLKERFGIELCFGL